MRIDSYLVEKGFFDSRTKAQNAIKNDGISVNGKIITKPSFLINDIDVINVISDPNKYVSRGGFKLEHAINNFNLDFNQKVILDIGSSTGGFTDCALKHGAKLVYAVDVGINQLDSSLIRNVGVKSFEETNILDFDVDQNFDFIVMDVSFVSIEKIIPAINKFLNYQNKMVCLIKPQFELGKIHIKNGVVKDPKLHLLVLNKVNLIFNCNNIYIENLLVSPIKGGSGNTEFLALLSKESSKIIDFKKIINDIKE